MQKKFLVFIALAFVGFLPVMNAQSDRLQQVISNTENINSPEHPCLNQSEYIEMESRCNANAEKFGVNKFSVSQSVVALNWPLRAANGFDVCDFYYVAAYVDQNPASTVFQDYNCGQNTYDGHRGTDIAIGPFPFYMMEHSQVEVIAAADGIIVDKHDGESDRNCVGSGSGLTANMIVLQHTDGSRTIYAHMKTNSVTTKNIGDAVSSGEYLGIVGSSGSSGGPHLHFEVWSGSSLSTLVDPFSGPCNLLNANSWWATQKPYTETEVIKASVHTTDISFPPCPTTEIPNESDTFSIPFQGVGLAPGYAKFYIFIRNSVSGGNVDLKILNPNGSTFNSWSVTLSITSRLSYAGFSKLLPVTPGLYTFQATYNGITCSHAFRIVSANSIDETEDASHFLSVTPNPVFSSCMLESIKPVSDAQLSVYNSYGQLVRREYHLQGQQFVFYPAELSAGMYYFTLVDKGNIVGRKKVMVMKNGN